MNNNILTIVEKIKFFYDNKTYKQLESKKFHYLSRMYLWTKETKYFNDLKTLEKKYIGISNKEMSEKIVFLSDIKNIGIPKRQFNLRKKYVSKYPLLRNYNKVLFRYLFAKTIYRRDIEFQINEIIPKKDFLDLYENLIKDEQAISKLSTFAINYFYLLNIYFNNTLNINPDFFFLVAQDNEYSKDSLELPIYLITHCIIGASEFYSKQIILFKDKYTNMLLFIEDLISKNFFLISLDNKLEFLVCCKILKYFSFLEEIIYSEAENSLSTEGNFLIDKYNLSKDGTFNDFKRSEHRNVLFIMALTKKT